ncbi:phosphatidylinositide phosphatase SAC2 isoform X2 [Planococcus citri]|uniref:phosphatidylinositide phosphatase SAC2 isoform X2 n=1 Tax=Planococcus citri TaxID=170843 RepID=UPI0031F98F38
MEIFRTENFFVLLCGESSLWIDKKSGELSIKPAWELANGQDPECLGIFFGFIGRIQCPVIEDYILLVRESVCVGELPSGHAVHKIKSIAMFNPTVDFYQDLNLKPCSKHHRIAYMQEQNIANSAISKTWTSLKTATTNIKTSAQSSTPLQFPNQNRKEAREREKYKRRIKEELHRIFTDTDSFYFCPAGGDITNSTYRQYLFSEKDSENYESNLLDYVDERFFWNQHMLQDIINIDSPLAKVWIMPIIQGYVEIKQCKTFFKENQKHEVFTISLISRRSRHRVGTRYKRRGLDEHGHCANYVETEQILQYKSHVVSFVQIRGSIPLFWSQQGYKYRPPPQLHKSYEENQVAFEKHLSEEIEMYGPVAIVNLVERTGKEAVVGDEYAEHICSFDNEKITYITFDLHYYCRGMKFENVSLLIDEIQDEISRMNYTWVDNQGLISKQNGTFRVNCIDCLDRTNVVQTAIAREVMMSQLIKLGLMSPEAPYNLLSITQQMWANNGDVISKQYAGTNALKGDITRTGNRKISGLMKDGMNSANRYYLNRFKDTTRQAALDIMLGNNIEEHINQQSNSSEDDEEDSPDSPINEEEHLLTIERIKQVIEDVKKLLIEDPCSVIASWALLNADYQNIHETSHSAEIDTILVLTRASCFLADYDGELDKVTKFQEIPLKNLKLLEIIVWNNPTSPSNSSGHMQKLSPSKNSQNTPVFVLHYCPNPEKPNVTMHYNFKSTNLRFFNNIAVTIKTDEEKIESLRAIAETIQVAYEVDGLGELELNVRMLQRKGSLLMPDNLKTSDVQFSSLKNVGSKALSNVSQQFSKFNKFGQNFRFSKNKDKTVPDTSIELTDTNTSQEAFLPTAGIVLSNADIESALKKDPVTGTSTECVQRCDSGANPEIIIDKASASLPLGAISSPEVKMEKSHSSDGVDTLVLKEQIGRSSSDKDLSLNLSSSAHEDNAFRSLRSGFTSATTALVSPSSPLSKLAKGMQNLSSNLDPRRLRNFERTQESFQISENTKVKEKWASTQCKSKLIAL